MQQVTDGTFIDEVLNIETPVVVDFYAEWCRPCKAMSPILEDLDAQYGDRIRFVKIDADSNPGIVNGLRISSIPTLVFIENGNQVGRIEGAMPKIKLRKEIDATFNI